MMIVGSIFIFGARITPCFESLLGSAYIIEPGTDSYVCQ